MSEYDAAVLAWADALRSGDTTPWSEFRPDGRHREGDPPGAAQLELVRRLGERWEGPGFDVLADRVLSREGPGRGLAHELLLAHPAAPYEAGAPPIDPADVPTEELLRVGIGVLADFALARPVPEEREHRRRWRLRKPEVAVNAPTLDDLLTQVWARKVRGGSAMPWRRFVFNWHARDALPLGADPARRAKRAAERVGAHRVHVYVGAAAERPDGLSVESVDLLRRLNPVLGLHATDLDGVRRVAVDLLAGPGTRTLSVPQAHRPWAEEQAVRIVEALVDGGYSVHGDLDEFAAGVRAPRQPHPDAVLDRLLAVVARAVEEQS